MKDVGWKIGKKVLALSVLALLIGSTVVIPQSIASSEMRKIEPRALPKQ